MVRSCEDRHARRVGGVDSKGLTVDSCIGPSGRQQAWDADAVQRDLEAHPGGKAFVAVFNGDNLPPEGAVVVASTQQGAVAFARSALGLPEGVNAPWVFEGAPQTGVVRLLEKPTEPRHRGPMKGEVGEHECVRLRYAFWGCRRAPSRAKERELLWPRCGDGGTLGMVVLSWCILDATILEIGAYSTKNADVRLDVK